MCAVIGAYLFISGGIELEYWRGMVEKGFSVLSNEVLRGEI